MAVIGPLVIFSGFVFVIFMLGLHNFLISNEENGCEMTYMIEYPQFVVSFGNLCQFYNTVDLLHIIISEVKPVYNVMLNMCEVTWMT